MFVEAATACKHAAEKTKVKSWWQPVAITLLSGLATLALTKANDLVNGRDARDADAVRTEKALDEQHATIMLLLQRLSWLEGRSGVRGDDRSTNNGEVQPPEVPSPTSQHNIPVTKTEIEVYQNEKAK